MSIGFLEALLLGVLIILLFGLGKLPTVLGDLGRGIRAFREEMRPGAADAAPPPPPAATSTGGRPPAPEPPVSARGDGA